MGLNRKIEKKWEMPGNSQKKIKFNFESNEGVKLFKQNRTIYFVQFEDTNMDRNSILFQFDIDYVSEHRRSSKWVC